MNARRVRLVGAALALVVATAAVSVLTTLALTGELGSSSDARSVAAAHDRLCSAARDWRDGAEAFESTSNTVDRSTPAGRLQLGDRFKVAANVVFPSSVGSTAESEMLAAIEQWNSAAEAWLFSLSKYYGVIAASSSASMAERLKTIDEQNALTLASNEKYRKVNPYLVDICALPPMELYKK